MGRSNCESDDGGAGKTVKTAVRKPSIPMPKPGPKPPTPTIFPGRTSRASAADVSSTAEYLLLKQRIDAILRSRECAMMQFAIGPYVVSGRGYAKVADAIASDTIKINIEAAAGHEASYNPGSRMLTLPRVDYGTARNERGSIVHEATHAIVDVYWGLNEASGTGLRSPQEEPIAYIAASVFNELNVRDAVSSMGPPQSHPDGEIQRQAALIGARVALELLNSKNALLKVMPRVDITELNLVSHAVATHPEYGP